MPPAGRKSLRPELAAVRRALSTLDKALTRLAARMKQAGRHAEAASERSPRKINLTPARRRALKLHGQYMGYVRQLKPRAKAEVRDLRMKKGIRAAIARALVAA